MPSAVGCGPTGEGGLGAELDGAACGRMAPRVAAGSLLPRIGRCEHRFALGRQPGRAAQQLASTAGPGGRIVNQPWDSCWGGREREWWGDSVCERIRDVGGWAGGGSKTLLEDKFLELRCAMKPA